jgi:hypothetical protein
MRLMEEEKYVREKKMIRCRLVYDALATFLLVHGGRPITLSYPRRSLHILLSICNEDKN